MKDIDYYNEQKSLGKLKVHQNIILSYGYSIHCADEPWSSEIEDIIKAIETAKLNSIDNRIYRNSDGEIYYYSVETPEEFKTRLKAERKEEKEVIEQEKWQLKYLYNKYKDEIIL